MRKWHLRRNTTALFLALTLSAVPALAEPSAADKETARALVQQGEAAYDAKDYAQALKDFEAAHGIMGVPTTGILVGKVQMQTGALLEARDTLLAVVRYPKRPDEPEAFTRARQEAAPLADALANRICTVEFSFTDVPAGAALTVTLDGTVLPPGVESVPRRLNPGKHTVVASVKDGPPSAVDFSVNEGESKRVPVRITSAAVATAAPAPPATESQVGPPTDVALSPPPSRPLSPIAIVGFSVGAAGIAVGAVTGLMALSNASAAKNLCVDNKCQPSAKDDIDGAKSKGTISTVGFAVGLVGLGVGIYGLIHHAGEKAEPRPAAWLRPAVGPGSFAVLGTF